MNITIYIYWGLTVIINHHVWNRDGQRDQNNGDKNMDTINAVKSACPVFKWTPFCTPTECILWDNLAKKECKTSKHLPIQILTKPYTYLFFKLKFYYMVLCQKRSVISILSFYLLQLPPRIYHFSISLFFW